MSLKGRIKVPSFSFGYLDKKPAIYTMSLNLFRVKN